MKNGGARPSLVPGEAHLGRSLQLTGLLSGLPPRGLRPNILEGDCSTLMTMTLSPTRAHPTWPTNREANPLSRAALPGKFPSLLLGRVDLFPLSHFAFRGAISSNTKWAGAPLPVRHFTARPGLSYEEPGLVVV